MPERSRAQGRPRHLAEGGELPPWWRALHPRRLVVALGATFLATPVLVLDHLPERATSAEAVEVVAPSSTTTTAAPTTTTTATPTRLATTTTAAPANTAPPTTAAPAPTTTARPRPTTTIAPPPTAAPTTVPPTTAPPPPPSPPPPPPGSVEEVIRAHFGPAGDDAVAVARCESSLNPRAQSPAGYRGLFQLDPSHADSFRQVTGREFEDAWDEADPNTQYAKWLYDRRGWAPWGACAP